MEAHEFSALFPMLGKPELTELAADIEEHGQREPITIFEGKVLDGRNRLAACECIGAKPWVEVFEGTREGALALVLSLNLHRRHLTETQRGMVGARLVSLYEEEARRRQVDAADRTNAARWGAESLEANLPRATGVDEERGCDDGDDWPEPSPKPEPPRAPQARDLAAAAVNVSGRTVQSAAKVLESGAPELVAAADAGEVAVSAAAKVATLPEDDQREALRMVQDGEAKTLTEAARKLPHVANNSGNNEWYTPPDYIEAARLAMGGIDLDPASCEIANRTVRADAFFDMEANGLEREWCGRVWMNPPYEKGLIDQFAAKLRDEWEAGRIEAACVLVNNATDTQWFATLAGVAAAVCFPQGRVRFHRPDGTKGAPLQGQAVLYIGSDAAAFASAFGGMGSVWHALR